MQTTYCLILALWAGTMLPLQAVINARLGRFIGGPIWASTVSALVSTVALVVLSSQLGGGRPRTGLMVSAPWWAWTGGLCGVVVLSVSASVTPRIGAAAMTALVMAGQVIVSLAFDRFGWLGLQAHPLSATRIAAALFLIAGAALMSAGS